MYSYQLLSLCCLSLHHKTFPPLYVQRPGPWLAQHWRANLPVHKLTDLTLLYHSNTESKTVEPVPGFTPKIGINISSRWSWLKYCGPLADLGMLLSWLTELVVRFSVGATLSIDCIHNTLRLNYALSPSCCVFSQSKINHHCSFCSCTSGMEFSIVQLIKVLQDCIFRLVSGGQLPSC